jgi:hypothetical protein
MHAGILHVSATELYVFQWGFREGSMAAEACGRVDKTRSF